MQCSSAQGSHFPISCKQMNYSHNIDLATTEIFSVGCYNANSTQCRYPSKPCSNDRALKENGEMHKFCDFHRAKANLNQRRLEQRRKLQKKLLQSANNDAQPSDGWLSTQSQLDMTGVMEYNALLQDASLDPISQEELSELLDLVAQSQVEQ